MRNMILPICLLITGCFLDSMGLAAFGHEPDDEDFDSMIGDEELDSEVTDASLDADSPVDSDDVDTDSGTQDAETVEPDTCSPTDEVCNGLDDDCDGEIDEDAVDSSRQCPWGR